MAGASYRPMGALSCVIAGALLACAEGEALDVVPDAHAPSSVGEDQNVGGAGGSPGFGGNVSTGGSGSGSGGGAPGMAGGSGGSPGTAGSSGVGGGSAGNAGSTGAGGTTGSGGASGSGGGSGNAGSAGAPDAGRMDASVGTGGAAGAPIDASSEPPPACPTCTLKVQYQCRQDGASVKEASFILKVLNVGTMPVALNTITLRYYYTVDTSAAQEADCDFAAVGCNNVSLGFKTVTPSKPKADRYLEVTLSGPDSGPASIAAGADSGEIQIRIHDPTYQAMYDQTNDYSFSSTGAIYVDAPTITAYSGATKVWGTEP